MLGDETQVFYSPCNIRCHQGLCGLLNYGWSTLKDVHLSYSSQHCPRHKRPILSPSQQIRWHQPQRVLPSGRLVEGEAQSQGVVIHLQGSLCTSRPVVIYIHPTKSLLLHLQIWFIRLTTNHVYKDTNLKDVLLFASSWFKVYQFSFEFLQRRVFW